MLKFSAVIVNYDSWPHTLRCVESLLETGREDLEVLVVDNEGGPTPELPREVVLIRNSTNEGFARACNQGIEASGGDCVVLVNPDALIERDFFNLLEEFFGTEPKAGMAGPRIIDAYGRLQLSARRDVGLVSGLLGRTSFLTRLFPESAMVRRMFPAADVPYGPREVDWVSGACLAARRGVLKEIGGFDERFFMYFEDADLCRRSREAGRAVYYLPQIEILHLTGASSRSRLHAVWRLHRSAFLYHRKHGPHGPLGIYSFLVLLGLCARAMAKLFATVLE
jgi:GT2 family glycosyltransferase